MKRFQPRLVAAFLLMPLALTAQGSESHKTAIEKKPDTSLERQKATTRDIRTIASAIEMFAVDKNAYPGPTKGAEETGSFLKGRLEPTYIKNLPSMDGWGRPFWYSSDGTDYTLVSYGKDGVPGSSAGGQTSDFNCDIIFANGQFFQWPSGTQR